MQPKGVVIEATPDLQKLVGYFGTLERIHGMVAIAQRRIEEAIGSPICVPTCKLNCCAHNSVACWGVEAELASSMILGTPEILREILARARDWLTAPRPGGGHWTYGSKITGEMWRDLKDEQFDALSSRCCFLDDERRCMIYNARPMVCRAYGVTRMPGAECERPIGIGEDRESRIWFHPDHPDLPIRPALRALMESISEPRYNREGFLATMIFERFRAKELAGLLYDGKMPLVKVAVGWGEQLALLWQEQLNREWGYEAADTSIMMQVPLTEVNGVPAMAVEVGRRR